MVTVSLFHSAIWAVSTMLQSAQYGQAATRYPMSRKDIANPLTVAHKTSDGRVVAKAGHGEHGGGVLVEQGAQDAAPGEVGGEVEAG